MNKLTNVDEGKITMIYLHLFHFNNLKAFIDISFYYLHSYFTKN